MSNWSQIMENPPYIPTNDLNKAYLPAKNKLAKDLTLLHLNIRSLIKNMDGLHQLLCKLPIEPEIIFLTETRLNSKSNLGFVQLDKYSFVKKNSFSSAGGVGMYVKNSLDFNLREDISLHSVAVESVWGEVNLTNSNGIIVGVVYKHPNTSIPEFSDLLKEILIKINNENKKCYIMGDFNINYLEKQNKPSTNNHFLMLKSLNFHTIFKSPTRITELTSTCIDHFYTNDKNSITNKFILLDDLSDHLPLFGTIKLNYRTKKQQTIYKRNFSKMNISKLQQDAEIKMNELLQNFVEYPNESIHKQFKILTESTKEIVNKNVPLLKLSQRKTKLLSKPWLTKGILKSARNKNKIYKKLVKNKFKDRKLHQKYKSYRNKLSHLIDISKKNHYEKLLVKSNKDSKKTWGIINEVIGKNKKATTLPTMLKTKDGLCSEPQTISNLLNIHFAKIGINDNTVIDYKEIDKNILHNQNKSIVLFPTTVEEVSRLISEMKNKNSEGPDKIPMNIIKIINQTISPVLCYLINRSLEIGIYPNCLKTSKVIPLFKSGDPKEAGNYRPISLLPALNKIFEKVLYNRLQSFFEKNNIINDNQFGFRKGLSTELAITKFYEDILGNLNNNHASCALFLDLSKAFDSVDRNILLHKLFKYGIRGVAYDIIQSYLQNRTQYIEVGNIKSSPCPTTVGVPQGSILSPLLFLIHINDLKNSTKLKTINFADDTLLYHRITNPTIAKNWLNNELNKILKWMQNNRLKLNLTKTNYLIFSPKSDKYKNLNDTNLFETKDYKIERKTHCKYLGIMIDKNVNWKPHINNLKTKLAKAVGILYRIRYYLNKNSLNLLIHSLIISHLKYGIICYARADKTSLQPLKVLFNNALRCVNFIKRKDRKKLKDLYSQHKMLTLDKMFNLELGKFCYKFFNGSLPNSFKSIFTKISKIHRHNTRNLNKRLYIKKQKNKSGLKTLSYQASKFWNELPNEIKNKKSIHTFSKSLKKYLLLN